LVNLKGEIVGINVAIFSTSGGNQGIGFAIPSNNAKRIIERLIQGKEIEYGWIGVTVQDLTEDLAKYFKLSAKSGAVVVKVLKDGPAEKGGMKNGDIIRQFDDKPVNSVRDLLGIVGQAEIGKKIKVLVNRDNKELTLELTIDKRPESAELESAPSEKTGPAALEPWRGLKVAELSEENLGRFKSEEKEGVLVVAVEPASPADDAGITASDVIIGLNKQPVANLSDYLRITKDLKGDVLVSLSRGYVILKEKSEK
jgi:serine protease Do